MTRTSDGLMDDIQARRLQDTIDLKNFKENLNSIIEKYGRKLFDEQKGRGNNVIANYEDFKKELYDSFILYIDYRIYIQTNSERPYRDEKEDVKRKEKEKLIEELEKKYPEIFLEYDDNRIYREYLQTKQEKFGYGSGGIIGRTGKALWGVLSRKKGK